MVPAFIKAGVKGVVLLASNAEKLAATEQSIKEANPKVETLICALDISDGQAVETAFEQVKAKFGYADILVNAAGTMTGDGPKLHETDPDAWWRNFVGVVFPLYLASPLNVCRRSTGREPTWSFVHSCASFRVQLPKPQSSTSAPGKPFMSYRRWEVTSCPSLFWTIWRRTLLRSTQV